MGDEDTPGTVPIDSLPDPVAGYGFSDEETVITEINDAFDGVFDASTGTTVRRWLRTEVGADDRTVGTICSTLADGGEVSVELGDRSVAGRTDGCCGCHVHTLDVADGPQDVEGYVLLSERPREGVEVDRIASVISHDLRNPLDVAKAHLRAARETGDEAHFDHLRESHDRMERIIQDVLTLARGENALNLSADIDIADVATDAWGTVDTETASLTLEEDLPTIQADPDRLQRLFENLFRNSVEHGSTGSRPEADDAGRASSSEPSVAGAPDDSVEHTESRDTVTEGNGDRENDSGDPLCLRVGSMRDGFFVADNGVGIPQEERTQVFDPGYSSSGTGLGLTIVRQIAEAHDWSVSLTTGSRGGARFEFQFSSGEGSA